MDAVKGRQTLSLSLSLPRKFFNFEKPRDAIRLIAAWKNETVSFHDIFFSFLFAPNFFHSKIISLEHAIIVATRSKIGNKDDTCGRNRMQRWEGTSANKYYRDGGSFHATRRDT